MVSSLYRFFPPPQPKPPTHQLQGRSPQISTTRTCHHFTSTYCQVDWWQFIQLFLFQEWDWWDEMQNPEMDEMSMEMMEILLKDRMWFLQTYINWWNWWCSWKNGRLQSFVLHIEPYGVEKKSPLECGKSKNLPNMHVNTKKLQHICSCDVPYKSAETTGNMALWHHQVVAWKGGWLR